MTTLRGDLIGQDAPCAGRPRRGTALIALCFFVGLTAPAVDLPAQSFNDPLSPLAVGLPSATRQPVTRPGEKVPDFVLADLNGTPRRFSSLAGHPVIVNLWATWCPPCLAEMPLLQSFYEQHKDEGLLLVGIDAGEPVHIVREFIESMDITYAVWLDPPGTEPPGSATLEVFERFGGIGLPTTVFIDEQGVLRKAHLGEIDRKSLEEQYEKISGSRRSGP